MRGLALVSGTVFDIRRFSIHDGTGIRTTVFFQGCPLACAWCHNPEGIASEPVLVYRENRCLRCGACVRACPQGAIALHDDVVHTDRDRCICCGTCVEACYAGARELAGCTMTVAEVLAEFERDTVFYDESNGGVTFSGGEPLMQADFLLALAQACRENGFHTALDTCGFAPWALLDRVREYIEMFLYDVKLIDDVRHRRFTGVSNACILDNLRHLTEGGHRIVLRLPLIPGINDDVENIRATGALAAELGISQVDVLPYHRAGVEKYERVGVLYALPEVRPLEAREVEAVVGMLRGFDLEVKVGG
jgi:pyruvate formate lyase activating enzyme